MKRFAYIQRIVQDYRLQQLDMINKDKSKTQYKPEVLVYLILHKTSLLKTSSRKFKAIYIGPLEVNKVIDKFQYFWMDNEGKILNVVFNLIELSKHI